MERSAQKSPKKVFRELITNGGEAQEVVEKNGWVQLSDPNKLLPIINEILITTNNLSMISKWKRSCGWLPSRSNHESN